MASPKSVQKVRDAIETAFERATDEAPTNQEIFALAGCSSATFYRVLEQHDDVQAMLDAKRYRFGIEKQPEDPISKNPHGAIKELRQVIAALVQVNAQLRERIDKQDREIERLLEQIPGDEVTHLSTKRTRKK